MTNHITPASALETAAIRLIHIKVRKGTAYHTAVREVRDQLLARSARRFDPEAYELARHLDF